MKYILFRLKRFCGFITGFVFFIAGIFKLLDPVGTGLIMSGYFDFLHLNFLDFAAKTTGLAFALAESIIGAALVTGIWRKSTAIAALCFQDKAPEPLPLLSFSDSSDIPSWADKYIYMGHKIGLI